MTDPDNLAVKIADTLSLDDSCRNDDILRIGGVIAEHYRSASACKSAQPPRLVDLFDKNVRGVSPLHFVEEQIKELQSESEFRAQMQAERDAARAEVDSLRKQLSDQADEISMLNAEAEMWRQRAEIAEAQLKKEADRE